MKLQPQPFEQIKNGVKTIEVRLLDEKRQGLSVGDTIIFSLMTDLSQTIETKVISLFTYNTFTELFDAFPPEVFGGKNKEELMGIYKYHTQEDEHKYGVVGIEIRLLER